MTNESQNAKHAEEVCCGCHEAVALPQACENCIGVVATDYSEYTSRKKFSAYWKRESAIDFSAIFSDLRFDLKSKYGLEVFVFAPERYI